MKTVSKIQGYVSLLLVLAVVSAACKKSDKPTPAPTPPAMLTRNDVLIDGRLTSNTAMLYDVKQSCTITFMFTHAVNRSTVLPAASLTENGGSSPIALTVTYQDHDSTVVFSPVNPLKSLTKYNFKLDTTILSVLNGKLPAPYYRTFITKIDSTPKFPTLSDDELLTKVQQQTFKYFWDYGHPVSGMARERSNGDDNVVTSGGTGFGIMSIPVAISRNFISRAEGLSRMQKIVGFLKNNVQTFHGAFPHWINGTSGAVVPFSLKDNGADLVETAYLMAGLLTARQYFNSADPDESTLRNDINVIWNNVDWSWFRRSNQNVLYWHWSPNYEWDMNMPIKGWNECLITYILGASSASTGIPANVYTSGWTSGSSFINGRTYLGYQLPLGPDYGGPLFFAHYSFMGVDPRGLQDGYANYLTQNTNHTLINRQFCISNPNNNLGYSADCWGLTASDIKNGYTASSPTNDVGVIAPTAALSSFPYTPNESMRALKYFYYTLGDKIWGNYGFVDAFSLKEQWFANSFLAIDQGPIIVMIENYRTGLVWNLFTSCPEVKNGMRALGFTAPYL